MNNPRRLKIIRMRRFGFNVRAIASDIGIDVSDVKAVLDDEKRAQDEMLRLKWSRRAAKN